MGRMKRTRQEDGREKAYGDWFGECAPYVREIWRRYDDGSDRERIYRESYDTGCVKGGKKGRNGYAGNVRETGALEG